MDSAESETLVYRAEIAPREHILPLLHRACLTRSICISWSFGWEIWINRWLSGLFFLISIIR